MIGNYQISYVHNFFSKFKNRVTPDQLASADHSQDEFIYTVEQARDHVI